MMPSYPVEDDGDADGFEVATWWDKLVADYAGVALRDVGSMLLFDYLALRRDALVTRMRATPDGEEWLRKAWLVEQTEPDRARLREAFGTR